ncbi:MAG: hypothetical protein AAB447_02180 [Patescibacteria group bacterium]
MPTLITIGIISLVALVALFWCKFRESVGKDSPLTAINRTLEPAVLLLFSVGRTVKDHLEPKKSKSLVLYAIVHATHIALNSMRRVLAQVHHKFTGMAQTMQGREVLLKGGASSVFLKSIAEHKKKIQEEISNS